MREPRPIKLPDLLGIVRRRRVRAGGRRVFLVATPGGHLDLLLVLRDAFDSYDRVWIVSAGSTADFLAAEGEEIRLLPRFHGFSLHNLARALQSIRLLLTERPSLVVTSGSGSVVPYCLGARLLGARIIFLETMARVTNASRAGRLLTPFASRVLVQWPEMGEIYRGARVCRPALLDHRAGREPSGQGEGTFVAVGTHIDPFDRLLRVVDDAVEHGLLPTPIVAQSGVSGYQPRNYKPAPWMHPTEIDTAVERSQYTVCHAGSGLIARALAAERTPMVLAGCTRWESTSTITNSRSPSDLVSTA